MSNSIWNTELMLRLPVFIVCRITQSKIDFRYSIANYGDSPNLFLKIKELRKTVNKL